jgi:hypothetical protein
MALKTQIRRPDGKLELSDDILQRCRADPRRYDWQIRRQARYDGLHPRKSRWDGRWYFSDQRNYLQSPKNGLTDAQALEWLLSEDAPD